MESGSFSEPYTLAPALARGWAVVIPDYEGLGTPGDHPWAVGRSLGHSVLDAIRAALALPGTGLASDAPVVLWGYSEGGFATAAAAELLPSYAPELNVVAAAPGGLARSLGDLLESLEPTQLGGPAFLMAMIGVNAAFPELALESQLNERGRQAVAIERSICVLGLEQLAFFDTRPSDYTKTGRNPLREPAAQARLEENSLTRQVPHVPLYMSHATEDEMLPLALGRKLRDAYCALGAHVSWTEYPGLDHIGGLTQSGEPVTDWLALRLAGEPLGPSGCPQDADSSEPPPSDASVPDREAPAPALVTGDGGAAIAQPDDERKAAQPSSTDAASPPPASAETTSATNAMGESERDPDARAEHDRAADAPSADQGCSLAERPGVPPAGVLLILLVLLRRSARSPVRVRAVGTAASRLALVGTLTLLACESAAQRASKPSETSDPETAGERTLDARVPSDDASLDASDQAAASSVDADLTVLPETDAAPQQDGNPPSAPVDDETRVASPEWHSYGHDLFNTRANLQETAIGPDNVAQLQLKWSWETTGVTGTPAYYAGKLYFGDSQGFVVALDAKSGKEEWRVASAKNPLGFVYGSASVTSDAVFVAAANAYLYRLDRQTGAFVWEVQIDPSENTNMFSSPVLVDDLVVLGVASYQNVNPLGPLVNTTPFRGSVQARDAQSGAQRWQFVLTTGTGVAVCSSAAIDPARKHLYIGTGNNYDATDSPYADSLLALNYETGAHVWHHQFTPRDEYSLIKPDGLDHDVLSSPVLFSLDGVDMVAVGDKGGTFAALRRDGSEVWRKQLTPGGHHGGVMGSPAYHDGVIYVCSGDFTTDEMPSGVGQSGPSESHLFALNARDGSELWSAPIMGLCYGAVSYANGVVYLPSGDGNLRAFEAERGEELWRQSLGQSSAGGVSIANGLLFVSYGWDWALPSPPGGIRAYGMP